MGNDNKGNKHRNIKIAFSVIKVMVLMGIVAGIPLYVYFCHGEWIQTFDSFEDVVGLLQEYEGHSIAVYIALQILQIVISVLPGQVFQIAAGYLFGPLPALLFSMTGAIAGTMLTFMMAKVLGRDMVLLILGEEKTEYYVDILNSKKAYIIVFTLYLIPGIPKDMISYLAGVTEMDFKSFVILSALGRMPAMFGSILIGAFLYHEIYMGVGIVAIIAVVSFILCLIFRKKILALVDRMYEKLSK